MKHLLPGEAWDFVQKTKDALFIDVRMEIEWPCAGRPPGVVSVPWYVYPELQPKPVSSVAAVERELEGDLNAQFHRSILNGWRHGGLPWEQM